MAEVSGVSVFARLVAVFLGGRAARLTPPPRCEKPPRGILVIFRRGSSDDQGMQVRNGSVCELVAVLLICVQPD